MFSLWCDGGFPLMYFIVIREDFPAMLFKWLLWCIVVCGSALLWGYMVDVVLWWFYCA